jgi:magnesium chelatase family protein
MTLREALETTKIHSVAGTKGVGLMNQRPFRSPHHTISNVALVGGGSYPQPGEISWRIMAFYFWMNCQNLRDVLK